METQEADQRSIICWGCYFPVENLGYHLLRTNSYDFKNLQTGNGNGINGILNFFIKKHQGNTALSEISCPKGFTSCESI